MSRPSFYRSSTQKLTGHIDHDVQEFSGDYDRTAPPVGLGMDGHDTNIMGPKLVLLDSFVVDLLNVDTSAQTFRLKLLVNMDWEDDGTIEPEVKARRNLAGAGGRKSFNSLDGESTGMGETVGSDSTQAMSVYRTGKYVLKRQFREDPVASTWNPEVVLANAIADDGVIEAGSKLHHVQMLSGRPVISRSVLYQPECRCEFDFSNYPFDETDLVVKFSSNKWNSEQVEFKWTHRLRSMGRDAWGRRISKLPQGQPPSIRRESSFLRRSVDKSAVGGVGLSEFEIIKVRVETDEKDVNSLQRYDNAEGAFSQALLMIRVRRDPYSYLLRVASVAELLMFLEFLSFLTDCDDLSGRFGISGTIFLAMVSLYGPMADALPKVSVVTRVDKWHLFNFFLLFLSNVENLLAFMLRSIVGERVLYWTECLFGVLYLHLVVVNLIWFINPLKEREEYIDMQVWFEDMVDCTRERSLKMLQKVIPYWKREETVMEKPTRLGMAVKAVHAETRMRKSITHQGRKQQGSPPLRRVRISEKRA